MNHEMKDMNHCLDNEIFGYQMEVSVEVIASMEISVLEVSKDTLGSEKMCLLWFRLKTSTHAGSKHNLKTTCSEINKRTNHSFV